jgi:hypothetical protein
VLLCVTTRFGLGYHIWDIPSSNVETFMKLIYSYTILFLLANPVIKLAILLFYRHIFCTSSHHFARLIDISLVLVGTWGISFFILAIFICTPLRAYWSPLRVTGQKCYEDDGNKVHGVTNVAIDLYLFLLPQYKIWHMRMEFRNKIVIATVMSFALLAVTASGMRLITLFKVIKNDDTPWEGMKLTLWSGAELTLGIVCTCVPALRAFFTRKNGAVVVGRMHTLHDVAQTSIKSVVMEEIRRRDEV